MEDRLFRAGPGCVYKVEYRSGKEIGGPLSSQQSLEVYAMWSIRSSKHFGGASGSHSTLAAPAKWSTRSGKEIGGPLNSQPNLEVCRVEYPPGKDL